MAKKISQSDLRSMMNRLKTEKGSAATNPRLKKYKLSSRELALIEEEKKRKAEDEVVSRKRFAAAAGVPDNFFDTAKNKAYQNLTKAPAKSILKNSGTARPPPTMGTNFNSAAAAARSKSGGASAARSEPSSTKSAAGGLKGLVQGNYGDSDDEEMAVDTPSKTGASKSQLPADFFDGGAPTATPAAPKPARIDHSMKGKEEAVAGGDDAPLPEGFFDDPIMDAKVRGIEYKNPEEEEWEAFKKEIAVELTVSSEMQAEGELEETTERQLEEIDEQIQAWGRVRQIEIKKDEIDERLKAKKDVKKESDDSDAEPDDEEAQLDEFLDWRLKKV